jgi:hypothetical protein
VSTSFYGRGGVEGSGSGTDNYNELKNKPIISLTGREDLPINLSSLVVGLYNLNGSYIFSNNDLEMKNFPSTTFAKVIIDAKTGDKIVSFDTYENTKHLSFSIDYFQDGSYKVDRYTYETINANADTTEDLPASGDVTQIYSTDKGLFVWNESKQDYVQLGTGEETEQTWDEM